MKTSARISSLATRISIIIAAIIMGLNLTSCSGSDSEPTGVEGSAETVKSAHITFTYTVPEELLKYAEITICRNNNEGTDAQWEPMLDSKVTVTYDITKFPVTAPVVFVYDFTNRPAGGVDANWELQMDTEVVLNIGGRTEVKTNSETFTITGNGAQGLTRLMQSPLDRTYAVKISKNGAVNFVH